MRNTTTLKFRPEVWQTIPADFLESIANRYGRFPREFTGIALQNSKA